MPELSKRVQSSFRNTKETEMWRESIKDKSPEEILKEGQEYWQRDMTL